MSSRSKAVVVCVERCVFVLVELVPNRHCSSIYRMGNGNGGSLLMMGFGWVRFALCSWMSPLWGRFRIRALWSPDYGV